VQAPIVLALDTSSALTSVAITSDRIVSEQSHVDARGHAEVLIPMVRTVIAAAGIAHPHVIACGVGPGPYTGLRVGIATAQALALSWSIPVVGVCSLDAVAWAVLATGEQEQLGVAMDARRREIYWATYNSTGERTAGPGVCRPNDLPIHNVNNVHNLNLTWVGSGVAGLSAESRVLEPQPWSPLGLPGLAGAMGLRVHSALSALSALRAPKALSPGASLIDGVESGSAGPSFESHAWLADHGSDSGATAQALAGRVLLRPEPLYLRRPDAIAGHA